MGPIYYFSAFAHHIEATKPGVVGRHQAYKRALEAVGREG